MKTPSAAAPVAPLSAHTPGPWHAVGLQAGVHGYNDQRHIYSGADRQTNYGTGCIANVPSSDANARLIASAPELLAVVQRLARYCEQNSVPELQGIACDAFAAITRATS